MTGSQRLGDYELLGEIARGGMGVVHYARQISLNRIVALKMIRSGELASAAEVQRFQTEAEAAANLDHPHIVPIYEIGEHDGNHYFSMKLMEGGTLAELSAECSVRSAEWLRSAAQLVAKLARAVSHAHQRGVLHRDIKPTNVLLDEAGEPHLTDFGLAKVVQDRPDVTQTLAVLGTPGYMSPEQAAGKSRQLTTAADVYSLGAVLFELLTGQAPFKGDSTLEVLKFVQEKEPPRPSRLNSAVDRDLETICLKCLEKEPARRYASAEWLAADLGHWLAGEPIQARPVMVFERSLKWARRNPVVAGLALAAHVILFAGVVGIVWQWRAATAQAIRADRNAQRADAMAAEDRLRLARSHVANGNRLLGEGNVHDAMLWFAAALKLDEGTSRAEDDRLRLAVALRVSPHLRQVMTQGSQVAVATYAQDGRRLLTGGADGSVWIWDVDSGRALLGPLKEESYIGAIAFFDQDSKFLVQLYDGFGARIRDAKTGEVLQSFEHRRARAAHLTQDGNWLLTCGSPDGMFKLWNARTGELLPPIIQHGNGQGFARFSPDGSRFATAGTDGTVKVWDRATRELVFPPLKQDGWVMELDFSGDGSRLIVANAEKSIQLWDMKTGEPVGPAVMIQGFQEITMQPDGKRLAAMSGSGAVKVFESATGKLEYPELRHKPSVRNLEFSPDNTKLAVGCADGTLTLWDLTQSDPPGRHLRQPQGISYTSFSPDGREVLAGCRDGLLRVWDLVPDTLALNPWKEPPAMVVDVGSGERLLTLNADKSAELWDTRTWKPASAKMAMHWLPGRAWLGARLDRLVIQCVASNIDLLQPPFPGEREFELQTWEPRTGRLLGSTHFRGDAPGKAWGSPEADLLLLAQGNRLVAMDTARWSISWEKKFSNAVSFVTCCKGTGRAAILAGKELHLVNRTNGAPLLDPIRVPVTFTYADFSPDGKSLATACGDLVSGQLAYVWDVETGEAVTPPLPHSESIWCIAFSPDGKKVATASRDRTTRVWNASTGVPLTPPMMHRFSMSHVAFSPDSRRLAAFGDADEVDLWDAETGEALTPPIPQPGGLAHGRFLGDGTVLFTQSRRGVASLLALPRENRPDTEWAEIASLLAGRKLAESGYLEAYDAAALTNLWAALRPTLAACVVSPTNSSTLALAPTPLPPAAAPSPLRIRFFGGGDSQK